MALLQGKFLPVTTRLSLCYRVLLYYWSNRSLRAWRQLLAFLFHRLAGRPVPVFVDIAPTYRCQCRCVHCSAAGHERTGEKELETQEIKSIIDEARHLGALYIIFTGGEPLLREDIVELVRYAHDAGMITRLNTNGLLLDRQKVAELKKAGLTICGVSLDRADAEAHDRLRGVSGAYKKALAGIRYLREFRLLSECLTYAAKEDFQSQLREVEALARRLGVSLLYIFFPIASGRWYNAFDRVLNSEEREAVRRIQDLTFAYTEIQTRKTLCCHVQKIFLYISAYGEIKPCPCARPSMGNIRQHSLRDLWYRYCSELKFEFRDDCPLNNPQDRKDFENFVESFAHKYSASH